ncbi:MAG: threonylcarbamoyl-AMP synthase [Muribaculaceae bacterium]|jgi:tRNA threonylcarbamoyl adenosine modification protein (Sua5/YciO/YrdC/YwlC family)
MKTFKMYASSINDRYVDEIVGMLRSGAIIIYPTDSLYAVGCDALNNRAVERVCRLKGINPDKQRLAIVCSDISQASEYARIDNEAFRLMKGNLPGPFTFILPASSRLSKAFKGRREVGVRVPDNEIARHLASALGNPLLTTTIEWDDADPDDLCQPSSISLHYADTVDAVVDGGEGHASPSAVVSLLDSSSPEILREGPVEPRL